MQTPIGKYGGVLAGVRPDDRAAFVVRDVLVGAARQAGEDNCSVAQRRCCSWGLPLDSGLTRGAGVGDRCVTIVAIGYAVAA